MLFKDCILCIFMKYAVKLGFIKSNSTLIVYLYIQILNFCSTNSISEIKFRLCQQKQEFNKFVLSPCCLLLESAKECVWVKELRKVNGFRQKGTLIHLLIPTLDSKSSGHQASKVQHWLTRTFPYFLPYVWGLSQADHTHTHTHITVHIQMLKLLNFIH
jgi:hypothetical protein